MNYKVAAIGSQDSAFPFYQAGIAVFPPSQGDALYRQVAQLIKEGYALLFICEDCLAEAQELLRMYDREAAVTIIPFPGMNGDRGIAAKRISDMVEKALGKNIL